MLFRNVFVELDTAGKRTRKQTDLLKEEVALQGSDWYQLELKSKPMEKKSTSIQKTIE